MQGIFRVLLTGLIFVTLHVGSAAAQSPGEYCAEKSTPKKISKCYRNALLDHHPELKPFGCGKKKNGWDQVARGNCLRDLLNAQQDESNMGNTSGGQDGIKLTAIAKCTKDVSYEGQPASSLAIKVTSCQENDWSRYIDDAIKLRAIARCTEDVSYEGQPTSSLAMKVTSCQESEWSRYITGAEGNCAAGENACIGIE